MRAARLPALATLVALILSAQGCALLQREGAEPVRLSRVDYAALPGWRDGNPATALTAFRRSCGRIDAAAPTDEMGGIGYAGTAADWQPACHGLPQSEEAARGYFESAFVPFAVTGGATPSGLFTGYFEPEISASHTQHDQYQTPVYGQPADLISVDLGEFRPALKGERIAGRVDGSRLVPYATRADIIARGLPAAPTLLYAADPVAVFFLQIQGSGRVRFDDGSMARLAYAAQNGQPYTAIGRTLIAEGALTPETTSLQSIRDWLHANPGRAAEIMNTNASFVFFKELPVGDPALGANGSEGVPLTPGASLAVDTRIHALGVPLFLSSALPDDGGVLDALLIAQDTGGAIRGAVRGDVYWGAGDAAENLAGKMRQEGKLFVLLPTALADRIGRAVEYASP